MTVPSYQCMDYTVFENESDGSIEFYGERNPNKGEVRLHEILFGTNLSQTSLGEIDILSKALNVKQMLLLRANCTHATDKNYKSQWHTDLSGKPEQIKSKTAILYLNTNNGGTAFQDTDEFVKSVANRCVIFPENTKHAGVWCTDKKLRFVLNINYIEN